MVNNFAYLFVSVSAEREIVRFNRDNFLVHILKFLACNLNAVFFIRFVIAVTLNRELICFSVFNVGNVKSRDVFNVCKTHKTIGEIHRFKVYIRERIIRRGVYIFTVFRHNVIIFAVFRTHENLLFFAVRIFKINVLSA